jgi:AcrR family transcriptional regulator
MDVKTKKQEQAETTRGELVSVARALFAEQGYGGTSLEQIVGRVGVTRGALYHHFAGKRELFAAVYEQVEAETTQQTAEAALAGSDVWQASQIGWRSFIDACRKPDVRRIVLLDAQSVLGSERYREIADRHGGALVRANLQALIDAGEIEPQPVEPLARILTGALIEAGIAIAEADDPDAATSEMSAAIERLIGGLRSKR